MIQLIKTVSVLAALMAVIGTFTVYGIGRTTDLAKADGHEGGGDPHCCDAPPPSDCCDAPPPEDNYVAPPPEDNYVAPPPDSEYVECTDCASYQPPPDGGYVECTDCTSYEPPPDGGFVGCTDCTFYEPPPDGGFVGCTDCTFYEPPPDGQFYYEPPSGEFFYEPQPGDFGIGDFNPDGGPFPDWPADPGFEGTFSFDDYGKFVFDGVHTFDGGSGFDGPVTFPEFGGPDFFPDGEFHEFFNPGDFAPDLFVNTFRPDEFAGDFGDFFLGGDFQPGEFDTLFNPHEFRTDQFGSFFAFDDFKPGDFGEFATVGDSYVDFGGHFDQFWGDRPEYAEQATNFFAGFEPGGFGFIPPEDLLGELHNLDYQGFQDLDSSLVADLFNEGVKGQAFDLRGDQWAGAFSKFEVDDIRGFDHDFIAGAVRDFNPEDFLGIPDDQAFALFEATFFGAPPPVVAFEGGLEGGTPPPFFDPAFFDQQLDQFEGQLVGFLGAMGPEHFDEIDDGQLVDIFGRIDFNDPDFDRTVLGGIFGSLDHESLAALSPGQIMGAIGGLNSSDFQGWDPSAAFNVFENINFDESKGMEHMGGLVGAMGPYQFQNIEGDKLVGLFDSFAFGGPGFDLVTSGMDPADIAGMIAAMDGQNMAELGAAGIISALQHLDDKAMGAWEGGAAFDVFNTIGFEDALGLDQLEGIVGNFDAEHIQQLGDNLGGLLGSLDFQNNGEVLQDFSFDTLGILTPEDFKDLDPQQLANLANTTGGDGIIGLDADQISTIVGNIQDEFFGDFDPSVVGGMFAGLDHDQIVGFDHETMEAALEAAGANLLGGLGDFNAIAGANTTFNELAELAGFAEALEHDGNFVIFDGAVEFFGGNLFGSG